MLEDIRAQPDVLRALAGHADEYEAVAREAASRGITTVRLVAHGSSDNAASFGVYAFGLGRAWTAFRDSISLHVYYGAAVDVSGSCVVALSQSGQTKDVVAYVARTRARGAYTVAVTNDPVSPLARAAEATLPLAAGTERAIAATRTYTAQIAALALLAGGPAYAEGMRELAGLIEAELPRLEQAAEDTAVLLEAAERLFVIGRGTEFATARELSLKLLETCRVGAQPLTATDLVHGPVAAAGERFPVWAIAADDANLPTVTEAVSRAAAAGAPVVVTGPAAAGIAGATRRIPLPPAPLPLLGPALSIVPGQLFARALALARGLDPDAPAGLTKVTLAP